MPQRKAASTILLSTDKEHTETFVCTSQEVTHNTVMVSPTTDVAACGQDHVTRLSLGQGRTGRLTCAGIGFGACEANPKLCCDLKTRTARNSRATDRPNGHAALSELDEKCTTKAPSRLTRSQRLRDLETLPFNIPSHSP